MNLTIPPTTTFLVKIDEEFENNKDRGEHSGPNTK